ncbi:curlin, partial [Pseudomonas soli]|nr:curlin [Pseudomonas soli]
MNALFPLLLCLALGGQAWADDLMDNADLAAGSDLG